MKNIFLSSLLLFVSLMHAQTLTQTFNEPKVGDINPAVNIDTSGYTTGLPLSITGVGSNWNFNKLKTASDNFYSHFVSPSTFTNASTYPGATVAQSDSGLVTFLKSVTTPTTRTEVLGFSSASLVATFTNPAISAVYPISIGSTFTDNIGGNIIYGTTNLTCSGKITYTADGTGTLTLGDGFSYNNVIRIKSVQTLTASIFILPVVTIDRITYDYYDASLKFPVFSVGYQIIAPTGSTGVVSGGVTGNSKSFTGITEWGPRATNLSLFPNPASNKVSLNMSDKTAGMVTIQLFDAEGQLKKNLELESSNLNSINIEGMAPGLYLLKIAHNNQNSYSKLLIE